MRQRLSLVRLPCGDSTQGRAQSPTGNRRRSLGGGLEIISKSQCHDHVIATSLLLCFTLTSSWPTNAHPSRHDDNSTGITAERTTTIITGIAAADNDNNHSVAATTNATSNYGSSCESPKKERKDSRLEVRLHHSHILSALTNL